MMEKLKQVFQPLLKVKPHFSKIVVLFLALGLTAGGVYLVFRMRAAVPGIYYLRADGNDSNAGTLNSSSGAWKTLGKALTTAVAGDKVLVYDDGGTFNVTSTVSSSNSGTAGSPITIEAPSGENPVFNGNNGNIKVIQLQDKRFITFKGLRFINFDFGSTPSWQFLINFSEGSDNITFDNITFENILIPSDGSNYPRCSIFFDGSKKYTEWSKTSGYNYVYGKQLTNTADKISLAVLASGDKLRNEVNSIAESDATSESFYFRNSDKMLFVHTAGNDDPDNYGGVDVYQGWNNVVKNSSFKYYKGAGLWYRHSVYPTISNNVFDGNYSGATYNGGAMNMGFELAQDVRGAKVFDNEVKNIWGGTGIWLDSHVYESEIYRNKVHDFKGANASESKRNRAIFNEARCNNNVIHHNEVWKAMFGIVVGYGGDSSSSICDNVSVFNNIVDESDVSYSIWGCKNTTWKNNISFRANKSHIGLAKFFYIYGQGHKFDHNNYFTSTGGENIAYIQPYDSETYFGYVLSMTPANKTLSEFRSALANWQKSATEWVEIANPREDNTINVNPLFTNAAIRDYTLQDTSPIKDAGVDVDYDENGYNSGTYWSGTAPDIGRYEYGTVNSPTPTPSPTSTPTPTPTPSLTSSPSPSPSPSPSLSPSPSPSPSPTLTPSSSPSPTPPPDTQPPTAPTNLTATSVSTYQINLSWIASTDNVGVTGYEVYRNNTKVADVTTLSFGDTGLSPSTTYCYYIKAYDVAGNKSTASNTACAKTNDPPATIQTGSITGTVSSSLGGVVSRAKIEIVISGTRRVIYTGTSGTYLISNIPVKTYDLKASAKNYIKQTVQATITNGVITTKNITLQKR